MKIFVPDASPLRYHKHEIVFLGLSMVWKRITLVNVFKVVHQDIESGKLKVSKFNFCISYTPSRKLWQAQCKLDPKRKIAALWWSQGHKYHKVQYKYLSNVKVKRRILKFFELIFEVSLTLFRSSDNCGIKRSERKIKIKKVKNAINAINRENGAITNHSNFFCQ